MAAARNGCGVRFSRRPHSYVGHKRYDGPAFTSTYVIQGVERLVALGLIAEVRGRPGIRDDGRQSRIYPTPQILEFSEFWEQPRFVLREQVHLKDSMKRRCDYEGAACIDAMRGEMQTINEAIGSSSVQIDPQAVDDDICREFRWRWDLGLNALVRIFNVDWEHGGRAYCGTWQNLAQEHRKHLLFDGEPTEEPDFEQLHPQLLYAACGMIVEGDAYTVPGIHRKLAKPAWQILMNSASRPGGAAALAKLLKNGAHVETRRDAMAEAKRMLEALEARHEPVRRAFYTGIGLRLQRVDSDLMVRVMLRAVNAGIVALPIHDSFVVRRGAAADTIRSIMSDDLSITLRGLRETPW